jgi:hypothetical protein
MIYNVYDAKNSKTRKPKLKGAVGSGDGEGSPAKKPTAPRGGFDFTMKISEERAARVGRLNYFTGGLPASVSFLFNSSRFL